MVYMRTEALLAAILSLVAIPVSSTPALASEDRATEPDQIQVLLETAGSSWSDDSTIIAAIIASFTVIFGWAISNWQVNHQLKAQTLQQQRDFQHSARQERAKVIREKLDSFFAPYDLLSRTNRSLHEVLAARHNGGDRDRFSLLEKLLEGFEFRDNDKALVEAIVDLDDKLSELISTKGGAVDDENLQEMLVEAAEHFRVLRLAHKGKLKGEVSAFKDKRYPRPRDGSNRTKGLDDTMTSEINRLRRELASIEADSQEFLRSAEAAP